MKRARAGFTIVELLVAITVMVIIAGIVTLTYSGVQRNSRDSVRESTIFTITQALEKYYDKNGEYPSVRSVANNYAGNTGSTVAALLGVEPSVLVLPLTPSATTNALTTTDPPKNDGITYIGYSSINNSGCQSSLSGGCTRYTLKYIKEQSGTTTVTSRHN